MSDVESKGGEVVVIGEALVGAIKTTYHGYFPPQKLRTAVDDRSLRGFVRILLHDDEGLSIFADGGHEEMERLNGALRALDTFRTESWHYTWQDFLDLLGRELGRGGGGGGGGGDVAIYEEGRGFVAPGKDYGKSLQERTAPYFEEANQKLDMMGGFDGSSREDFLRWLQQINPGEYQASAAAAAAERGGHGSTSTWRGIDEASSAMDVDVEDHSTGASLASSTSEARRGGAGAGAGAAELEVEVENDALRAKDEAIAAVEKQLAALKMSIGGAASQPQQQQQQQQQGLAAASPVAVPTLQQSSRWQSDLQVSDEVERRIALRAIQPRVAPTAMAAPKDSFLRKGPLSADQEREVDHAFNSGPELEVLVKAFNADITRRDLRCLRPETWLNDEVVNMYMQLLAARDKELCAADPTRRPSHFFNSFFLAKLRGQDGVYNYRGVRRWTRKVKVFEMDKIFVPVNVSNTHWCMAVIYVQDKRINYYDSMGGGGKATRDALMDWLEDEDEDKNGDDATFEPDDWTSIGTNVATTPQQENGSDCGAFAVSFASYISDNLPFDFRQEDITQMRRRMVWSILNQRLV